MLFMNIMQIIFVGVITITTFVISILTAKIYILGLGLSTGATRVVNIIGIVAPLLFILSMFLSRVVKSDLLNSFSYSVNALGGIIFYLFLTGVVLGIVLLIGNKLSINVPSFVGYVFLILGLSAGVGGLIQAKFIKVVSYDVYLKDAPSSWQGKRGLLVSDTHFGLVNHKNFSDKVVDRILKEKPDFVLHAGDFYDGPDNDTALITESWKKLTKEIPVFYAPGNHEEYGDYNGFLTSVKNAGVTALVDNVTQYEGVQIAGITYRDKGATAIADMALKSINIDNTKPLILINHPPTFQPSAIEIGTDLMVSGHTHRGQFWPIRYLVRAIYGKYSYGINQDGTLTSITTSGVGTAGPPLRLFNTPELVILNFKVR